MVSLDTYNKVLKSISKIRLNQFQTMEDKLSSLLTVYADMLSHLITPNVKTYTIIVNTLLDGSLITYHTQELIPSFSDVLPRHLNSKNLLNPTLNAVSMLKESEVYFQVALDVFLASFIVKNEKKFDPKIYYKLINCFTIFNKSLTHEASIENDKKLIKIINLMEKNNISKNEQCYLDLIKSFGYKKDLQSVLTIFEDYKLNLNLKHEKEYQIYGALIESFVLNNEKSKALQFMDKIVSRDEGENNIHLVSGFISGLISIGDVETSWNFIQHLQSNSTTDLTSLLDMSLMSRLITCACQNDNFKLATLIFDFIVPQKQINTQSFWDFRCDYILQCIKENDLSKVLTILKETEIREAFYDESTILVVFKFLVENDLNHQAMEMLINQSKRIIIEFSNYDNERLIEDYPCVLKYQQEICCDLFNKIVEFLSSNGKLNLKNCLELSKISFFNASLFELSSSNNDNSKNGSLIILKKIWNSRINHDDEFLELINKNELLIPEIVSLHTNYLIDHQSQSQNSTLTKSTTIINNDIKYNLMIFIKDLIIQKPLISKNLINDVTQVLKLINENDLLDDWIKSNPESWYKSPLISPSSSSTTNGGIQLIKDDSDSNSLINGIPLTPLSLSSVPIVGIPSINDYEFNK